MGLYMFREITEQQAREIYLILKEDCGYAPAQEDGEYFVRAITTHAGKQDRFVCQEFRFCGNLGFGGKFRNNGNNHNIPYVDCYPEHENPNRTADITRANRRIAALFLDYDMDKDHRDDLP